MHRFFVPEAALRGDAVALDGAAARQLFRVLRARVGEEITLLDNTGWEYRVALTAVGAGGVTGAIVNRAAATGEPRVAVTLLQSLLKTDRFEFVLEKGTELGVAAFVPVVCARTVRRPREGREGDARMARWARIIKEAAEQSGRGRLPTLAPPMPVEEACRRRKGLGVLPWEEEAAVGLRSLLRRATAGGASVGHVDVLVGPEGGFEPGEVEYARLQGFATVSLGRRILRSETAGAAAVAAILYELGEFGG